MVKDNVGQKYENSEALLKAMGNLGSSAPLAARRNLEAQYGLMYRRLIAQGKAYRLKRKYTKF